MILQKTNDGPNDLVRVLSKWEVNIIAADQFEALPEHVWCTCKHSDTPPEPRREIIIVDNNAEIDTFVIIVLITLENSAKFRDCLGKEAPFA